MTEIAKEMETVAVLALAQRMSDAWQSQAQAAHSEVIGSQP